MFYSSDGLRFLNRWVQFWRSAEHTPWNDVVAFVGSDRPHGPRILWSPQDPMDKPAHPGLKLTPVKRVFDHPPNEILDIRIDLVLLRVQNLLNKGKRLLHGGLGEVIEKAGLD